jgi:hypothetical protein
MRTIIPRYMNLLSFERKQKGTSITDRNLSIPFTLTQSSKSESRKRSQEIKTFIQILPGIHFVPADIAFGCSFRVMI